MKKPYVYPKVYTEDETLEQALAGRSIARFGDGELRLALGGQAISQCKDKTLELAFRSMLIRPPHECLICLPNLISDTPSMWFWKKYLDQKFVKLYDPKYKYGSTWMTRPDNAPWINNEVYWAKVRGLWRGKDVTLVTGNEKSLTLGKMHDAASVETIMGPRVNAFCEIDRIEKEVVAKERLTVLLCLGATATVLAVRLARRGFHALDLGHLGMFMRRFHDKNKEPVVA